MSLMSDAHRLDRRGHEALTVDVNLQTESDADPTELEHTAAEGRAANRSFQCLGEVATTLDEGAPGFGIKQEYLVLAVVRAHIDRRERLHRPERWSNMCASTETVSFSNRTTITLGGEFALGIERARRSGMQRFPWLWKAIMSRKR